MGPQRLHTISPKRRERACTVPHADARANIGGPARPHSRCAGRAYEMPCADTRASMGALMIINNKNYYALNNSMVGLKR